MTDVAVDDKVKQDELEVALSHFDAFLQGSQKKPSLRQNWIGLQVFATYADRLPHTTNDIREHLHLKVGETTAYRWFPDMVKAHEGLADSSDFFFEHILENMMDLGNGLKSFVADAAGEDSIFTLIADLVSRGPDRDLDEALDILKDIKSDAVENKNAAAVIKANLHDYHDQLTKCQAKFVAVKSSVDTDDQTSQTTINQLKGGAEITGSLAQLRAERKKDDDEYDKDVAVAATTPTYFYVFPPFSSMVAVGIAIGYTIKALDMLDKRDKVDGAIATADLELKKAVAAQDVVTSAQDGLETVISHAETAIKKVTAIESGWTGVVDGLDYISGKVSSSLKPDGPEGQKLNATRQIKHYMKKSQGRWTELKPVIEQMTSNVLIYVEPGKTDVKALIAKLEAEIKAKS